MQFLMSFTVVFILLAMIVGGMCVPTSVLAKNSELNNKVKRSSNEKTHQSPQASAAGGNRENYNDFTTNNKNSNMQSLSAPTSNTATSLNTGISVGSDIEGQQHQQQQQQQQQQQHLSSAPILQKRGVNSQLMYGGADLYNNPIPSAALTSGGGVWSDEIDPPLMYSDLQDLQDEYPPRGQYRSNNKGYDNLQNILNSEAYLEPFAMPLQYSNRYYGDRKKRSNNKLNKYDMRLKRESKLTPADMLALVALVEAGERSRKESEPDTYAIPDTYYPASAVAAKSYYPNSNNNYNNYEYQNNDDSDISSSWVEPSIVDYYGVPYNVDALPKYEIAREHKYGVNRYPTKRFMVSKKKRSLGSGRFSAEPISTVSLTPEHFAKLSKSQKYF